MPNIKITPCSYSANFKPSTKANKRLKSVLSVVLGLLFFTPLTAKQEELATKYSIHVLGANIGEFSVTQTNNNGTLNIKAITDVQVNLIFSYRVKFIQNTIYKQGILQSSHVETYKNGKLNSTMWMKYETDSYLIVSDGDTSFINGPITYSGSLVYFNEPIGISHLFKERSSKIESITKISEHSYAIKDKRDREVNRYCYEDGILQNVQIRYTLANIELKRKTIQTSND